MRRRLAGLVLLVGAVVVGGYLVRGRDRIVPVEVHYVLGDPAGVSHLEAVYREKGDDAVVARFATEMLGPEVVQKTRLPRGELDVEVRLGEAAPVRRTVEARRDAVIRLELSKEPRGGADRGAPARGAAERPRAPRQSEAPSDNGERR